MNIIAKSLPLILACLLLVACGQSGKAPDSKLDKQAKLDQVLVKVNGTDITNYDLQLALVTLLGEQQSTLLDRNGRKKALESMVMSRVISQAAEKELTDDDKAKLDKRLAAHREQLLVNYYLRKHSEVGSVSNEMIKDYYDKNLEKFGSKKVRTYEMIFGNTRIDLAQRDQVINALKKVGQQKDWSATVKQLRDKGFSLQYRKGTDDNAVLQERIRALVNSTEVGKVSQLTFVQGKPYIVRVLEEKQSAAKPLQQVSSEIRKALVPLQMKNAIDQVSENLMKAAKIQYVEN